MKRLWVLLLLASVGVRAYLPHISLAPKGVSSRQHPSIELLDSVVLEYDAIDGVPFRDISALAYDREHDRLYLLGDKGSLFTARLKIARGRIVSFEPLSGRRLHTRALRRLLKPYRDSEGMTLLKRGAQTQLLISFEHFPRIERYSLKGREIGPIPLPKVLRVRRNYHGNNRMLESVAIDPIRGAISTPERPLRIQKHGYHGLYDERGEICKIPDLEGYSITELTSVAPSRLLALERKVDWRHLGFDIRLVAVDLIPRRGLCATRTLLEMRAKEGWHTDNFEGLCHWRDDLFLMISDNNANPFQRTILTLFRLR